MKEPVQAPGVVCPLDDARLPQGKAGKKIPEEDANVLISAAKVIIDLIPVG